MQVKLKTIGEGLQLLLELHDALVLWGVPCNWSTGCWSDLIILLCASWLKLILTFTKIVAKSIDIAIGDNLKICTAIAIGSLSAILVGVSIGIAIWGSNGDTFMKYC